MRFYTNGAVCLVLLLAYGLSGATNYYIDQVAGNDSSNGTNIVSPWKTLAKANSVTHGPGDTLFLRCKSVWVDGLVAKGDGSVLSPVVVTSYGNGRAPRIQGANQDNSICVYIEGVDYWKVQNLEISNAEYGIVLDGRKSYGKKGITIEKCFFHDLRTNAEYYRSPADGPVWGGAIQIWSHQTIGGIPSSTVRFDQVTIRNCISQNCDGFLFQRNQDGGATSGLYGNLLIDGCTMKGHSFNTCTLEDDANQDGGRANDSIFQTIRNCVFMNNGGLRHFYNGGTDVLIRVANGTVEDCEFGNRTMPQSDPDGCALDYEGSAPNSIIRRCDIHGSRSGALLLMSVVSGNCGFVDNLLRYNGREYAKYEIYSQTSSATGPIQGNTYYLLPGTEFLSKAGAFTVSNNIAGTKAFVATPTASDGEGTYSEAISISLACATDGAVIRYTTDGSYPNTNSPIYSAPILIGKTTALNAKAFKDGMEQSYGLSNIYVIESTPNLSITLVDSITGQPVKTSTSVVLKYLSATIANTTDSSGSFFFLADSVGRYTVDVSPKGYVAKSGLDVVLAEGKTTRLVLQCVRRALTGIDIRPKTVGMVFNWQQQVSLYGIYADGTKMLVANSVPTLWTSRSPEVVSVSGDGLLASKALAGSCFVVADIPSLGFKDSTSVDVVETPLITVNNPSFEMPVSPSDWTISGSAGIEADGGPYLQANAPDGTHVGRLQNISSFSQDVVFYAGVYRVQFMASMRVNSWDGSIQRQTIEVYIDAIKIGSVTPANGAFIAYSTSPISLTAGVHTLRLQGVNGGDNSAFIDQVSIVNKDTLYTEDEPWIGTEENATLSTSPNPFNPSVNIQVRGCNNFAALKILNVNGKVVADLSALLNSASRGMGARSVVWNAAGHASGVYVIVLKNGKMELKRKVMLIR